MFFSYDEPGIRATYSVELRHHENYTAVSNMPLISRLTDPDPSYVVSKFAELPSVQSYLVAFIIFDFSYVEDTTGEVPHRVYASPQAILDGEAALAIGVSRQILLKFEEYLGVNYTLPKMDQSVIPSFSSGNFLI